MSESRLIRFIYSKLIVQPNVGSLAISAFYKLISEIIIQAAGDVTFTNNGIVVDNVYTRVQAANIQNEVTDTEFFIPDSDGRRGARSLFENDLRVTLSARFSF
ncbi:MAG: hypothetical protein Kow00133_09410 [Amphiplicatus sp.]